MFLVTFLIKTCLFIKLTFMVALFINLCQNLEESRCPSVVEVSTVMYQLNGILFIVKKKVASHEKNPKHIIKRKKPI